MGRNISLVSSVASHFKKVKLMILLSLKLWKWRLIADINNVGRAYSRIKRWRSFNAGRRRGLLCGCFEEEEDDQFESSSNIRRLQRTSSSYYGYNSEHHVVDGDDDQDDDDYEYDDVDRRAEIFITNFRSQLLMEREVSLKLRYCQN